MMCEHSYHSEGGAVYCTFGLDNDIPQLPEIKSYHCMECQQNPNRHYRRGIKTRHQEKERRKKVEKTYMFIQKCPKIHDWCITKPELLTTGYILDSRVRSYKYDGYTYLIHEEGFCGEPE